MLRVFDANGAELLSATDDGGIVDVASLPLRKFWEHVWDSGFVGMFPGREMRETQAGDPDFLDALEYHLFMYNLFLRQDDGEDAAPKSTKGGPGSGNWGHGGRPGHVGGSTPGEGGLGGMLDLPKGTQADVYQNNPRFQALADGIGLHTHGGHEALREASVEGVRDAADPAGAYRQAQLQGLEAWEALPELDRWSQDDDVVLRSIPGRGRQLDVEMVEIQGFHGPAQVTSSAELDAAIQGGARELFRGVTERDYATQFQDGELFVGQGVFGNGTYTAYGKSGPLVAEEYAGDGGVVLRMALRPDARVIDESPLKELIVKTQSHLDDRIAQSLREDIKAGMRRGRRGRRGQESAKTRQLRMLRRITEDNGRFATSLGYDAINIRDFQYMSVLNRTALLVQRELVRTPVQKGGPGSGNWGHGGRPGHVGGSTPGEGGLGGTLDLPKTIQADVYQNNPRFQALADGIGLHAHGGHEALREASVEAAQDAAAPAGAYRQAGIQGLEAWEALPELDELSKDEMVAFRFIPDRGMRLDVEMLQLQGFDGAPQIVSASELDDAIQQGAQEMFRGVTEEYQARQFQDGDLFVGRGMYGNGTYTAYGDRGSSVAREYAGAGGAVLRMALRPDARVADMEDEVFENAWMGAHKQVQDRLQGAIRAGDVAEARRLKVLEAITHDPGRFATSLGYDALKVGLGRLEYMLVLNRTALLVQRELVGP